MRKALSYGKRRTLTTLSALTSSGLEPAAPNCDSMLSRSLTLMRPSPSTSEEQTCTAAPSATPNKHVKIRPHQSTRFNQTHEQRTSGLAWPATTVAVAKSVAKRIISAVQFSCEASTVGRTKCRARATPARGSLCKGRRVDRRWTNTTACSTLNTVLSIVGFLLLRGSYRTQ